MRTTVSIPGIHCEGCAALIKDVSSEDTRIKNVHVDLNAKTVTLDHAPDFDLKKWSEEIESLDEKYKIQPSPRLRPASHPLP
jgi:copper chaperone CopZ